MRIARLQQQMKETKVNQCLLSETSALQYFIDKNFSCGERLVVLLVEQTGLPRLFLNDLFPCEQSHEFELVRFHDTDAPIQLLSRFITGPVLAVDSNWSAGFLLELMNCHSTVHMINASVLSDHIRAIKTVEEQEKMRKASEFNDAVMQQVRTMIRIGMSECQLRDQINATFLKIANSLPSFETIVAFGENGADPHCVPSDKILEAGMSVIVDMGCRFEGYCSDMTRTFFVGENTLSEIYDTVLKANLAAIAKVKPGVLFSEIDRAAREVIEKAGYGQYFIHRTGHGIGLNVHEPYDVSAVNDLRVVAGMCFSIEPGIYIPNQGGVRIEDLVLVTEDGCEVLNKQSKTEPIL